MHKNVLIRGEICHFLQVLSSWMKVLPKNYTVNDFIAEIQEWDEEGYLDDEVWKRLKKCVSSDAVEWRTPKPETERITVAKQETHTEKNVNPESEMVRQKNPEVGTTRDIKQESAATYQPQSGNKGPAEDTTERREGISSNSSAGEESGTLLPPSQGKDTNKDF